MSESKEKKVGTFLKELNLDKPKNQPNIRIKTNQVCIRLKENNIKENLLLAAQHAKHGRFDCPTIAHPDIGASYHWYSTSMELQLKELGQTGNPLVMENLECTSDSIASMFTALAEYVTEESEVESPSVIITYKIVLRHKYEGFNSYVFYPDKNNTTSVIDQLIFSIKNGDMDEIVRQEKRSFITVEAIPDKGPAAIKGRIYNKSNVTSTDILTLAESLKVALQYGDPQRINFSFFLEKKENKMEQ